MPQANCTSVLQSGTLRRPAFPIVRQREFHASRHERNIIQRVAERLLGDEPALSCCDVFGPRTGCGLDDAPSLFVADAREITLLDPRINQTYGYRLSMLAASGDVVLFEGERDTDFEAYRTRTLGLGNPEFITLPLTFAGQTRCLTQRAMEEPQTRDRLLSWLGQSSRVNIVPHIATGHVWNFAAVLARAGNTHVSIAGPPPRLTRRVNDKLWFSNAVKQVLGAHALPPVRGVYGPAALTNVVARLAERHDQVVVKVPDSAGSRGNVTMSSSGIRGKSTSQLKKQITTVLHSLGWRDAFPVLVEVWETSVQSSPSVQIWIPHREDGDPIIEGVFEQMVKGGAGEFVGSLPCRLSEADVERLAEQAGRLALLFQELGYYGRCSFDAILTGEKIGKTTLHWIECNGRWGGVSIPMTLVNRISGNWSTTPFVVQRADCPRTLQTMSACKRALEDLLLDRRGGDRSGLILLAPPAHLDSTRLHTVTVAPDRQTALDLIEKTRHRLLRN